MGYAERRLDPAERARIEAHLDGCSSCLTLVCEVARSGQSPSSTELAPTLLDSSKPADPGDPRDLGRDSAVDRYRIVRMIGQGGMGSVYEAYDPQLDRKLALKLVRTGRLADPSLRARLAREARTMAKLSHPNVVTIFDAGDFGNDFFIAMELVPGVTLGNWLTRTGRSYDEVMKVMLAAGRGLSAAHAAGIVHRDFKPDNVLVDEAGRVLVTDFGLAVPPPRGKPGDNDPGEVPSSALGLTHAGALVGTPRYMSPEQYAGTRLDARSDEFSFAVALYEALYGQRPFEGNSIDEIRQAVGQGRIRPPPVDDKVPAYVREALTRALSASPDDRFPSLDALLVAIAKGSASVPVLPPGSARATAWVAAAILGCAALVAAVRLGRGVTGGTTDGAAGSSVATSTTPAIPSFGSSTQVLILGLENRTSDPVLDGTLDLVLESALTRSPTLYPLAGSSARALVSQAAPEAGNDDELLGRTIAERTHRPVVIVRGAVTPDGAGFHVSLEAVDGASNTRLLASTLHADGPASLAPTVARLACALRARVHDAPCDDASRDVTGLSPNIEADHEYTIGRGLGNSGKIAEGVAALERAIAIDPDFAMAHSILGSNLWNGGRTAEGQAQLQLGLAGSKELSDRQRLAMSAVNHLLMDEFDLAAASYEELLTRWPGDTRYRGNLAEVYLLSGDLASAVKAGQQAAADNARSAILRSNLPTILAIAGDLDGSARESRTCLAEFPHPPSFAYSTAAVVALLQGHPADAADLYHRLETVDASSAATSKADFAIFEGRFAEAIALLRTAIAEDGAKNATADAQAKWAMIAEALQEQGDVRAAHEATGHAKDSHDLVTLFRVARVLALLGQEGEASLIERTIKTRPGQRAPLFLRVLATDAAAAHHATPAALDALATNAQGSGSWLAHADLGAAYLETGALERAVRELEICASTLGRGGMAFYDDTATLRYLRPARYALARAKDALHRPDAAAEYERFLAMTPGPSDDPRVADVRRRLATIGQ